MSSKETRQARQIAETLGTKYAAALRYVRAATEKNGVMDLADLTLACRQEMEDEENRRKAKNRQLAKAQRRGALPKGAGAVRCTACGAEARADGEGTPITVKCDDDCPEKYPIKDHRYDAGWPRDDSKGCWHDYGLHPGDEPRICTRPLSEHAHSEYPEDGR